MMTLHYQITVQEYLDESWSAHFDGLTITHDQGGATTLAGAVRNQTALYGLIAKLRDLRLTLLSVATVVPSTETGHERAHHRPRHNSIGTQGGTHYGNFN